MSYSGKFKDKNNNLHPVTSVLYGTCDTAAATAAKVVTCSDFDALMTGVTIRVKFANANTAESPTVNINSTGAKSVYRFGSTAPVDGSSWNAGEVVELVYDGTSFFMTGADDIAAKQDATDNSLETTDKTIVGAINEHDGDIGTLKSGFTTLDNEVNGDAVEYPYADVITIPDAVPANLADCSVKIEPVQDLHGQSAPYVGGAGKNKLPLTVDGIKALNSGLTWNGNTAIKGGVPFTILTDSDNNVLGIKALGTSTAQIWYFNVAHITTTETMLFNTGNTYSWDGNKIVCEVTDGTNTYHASTLNGVEVPAGTYDVVIAAQNNATVDVTFLPMFRATTETDATFAPYTNICPITGHTEASVQRDGRNRCDNSTNIIGFYGHDGVYSASSDYKTSALIPVSPNTSYTASVFDTTTNQRVNGLVYTEWDAYGNFIGQTASSVTSITTTANTKFIRVRNYNADTTLINSNHYAYQVELGSSATDYEPFKGKTYTIALGDTIYGGTVDFDSGVMTVTHGYAEFDGSVDEGWTVVDSGKRIRTNAISSLVKRPIDAAAKVGAISNMFDEITANETYGGNCGFSFDNGGWLAVADGTKSMTKEAFDNFLSINHLYICYPLATPTTIQLTPQQIQLLKGTNTLTASTGQISVTANGVSGAIGSLTADKQDKTDYALETTAKTVVGGINELKNRVKVIEVTTSDTVDQGTTVKVPSGYDAAKAVIVGYTAQRTNNIWYNTDDHVKVGMYADYLYVVPKNADVLERTVKVILIKFSA